jgi:hypothetical protein
MTFFAQLEGIHNDNFDASVSRVMEDATWKRQRIIVIQPAARLIPAVAHLAQWDLIFPPNNGVAKIMAQGMEVGHAYSSAIDQVLAHSQLREWEYILTIEQDNCPPRDGILALLRTLDAHPEFAAVSGLYWCKGETGCAHIWGDVADPMPNFRPQVPRADTVQECCGISMGFALWRLSLFADERLPRPFFKTKAGSEGVGTQDLAFWSSGARALGYRCAVDTRVKVGHVSTEDDRIW